MRVVLGIDSEVLDEVLELNRRANAAAFNSDGGSERHLRAAALTALLNGISVAATATANRNGEFDSERQTEIGLECGFHQHEECVMTECTCGCHED